MECATGVRTAPTGAGWIWATLADSPSSYHIPSLAPAVALPAPRHDRRRTGAAGAPPGGFPFVELASALARRVHTGGSPVPLSVFGRAFYPAALARLPPQSTFFASTSLRKD